MIYVPFKKMDILLLLYMLFATVSPSIQQCSSFPSALDGTWTSTNLETITIDSTSMSLSTTKTFVNSHSASHFDCVLNSGTQYVFKMNQTVTILGGTLDVYPYGCFDFRQASTYSYYYYLNSAEEVTLSNLRFRAVLTSSVDTITAVTDICDSSTVDVAEFHTMVKTGNETAAISAVQCPDPILGFFQYTYTDQTGTYCDGVNTSTIIACSNQSYAELLIDNTGCTTKEPFYSAGGEVGCIANIYNSATSIYYTSYYNKDASLSTTSSQFTCVAMQQGSNGTVFLSLMQTDCVTGQTATQLPEKDGTRGATMVLEPTCIPPSGDKKTSWVWLIVFLVCFVFLVAFVILVICLHKRCKTGETKKAREKKVLVTAYKSLKVPSQAISLGLAVMLAQKEHPLGEVSIALDAPTSMERVPDGYIDLDNEFIVSPRRFKKKDMMYPMNETSMNLNFKEKSWVGLTPRKSIVAMDPFSEMDSGVVLPISSFGSKTPRSKTPRSMRSPTKQKSFLLNSARTPHPYMNGDVKQPLAITDGRTPYPIVKDDDELFDVKSFRKESITRSKSIYAGSVRAPSVRAQSVKAMSVRSKTVVAPSVRAPSVGLQSVRAPSAGAPSVAAKSTKSIKSYKALSVRSNKSGTKSVPRLVRSTSNTRLGSVTKRAPLSPRKGMSRSKSSVLPLESKHNDEESGMAEFMNAEMSNWGDASQSARSKRSTRTSRSVAKSKNFSKTAPTKSILRKKSRYMSTEEFLTEEEKYYHNLSGTTGPPENSVPANGTASRTLLKEYAEMERRNKPRLKKIGASKKPWH